MPCFTCSLGSISRSKCFFPRLRWNRGIYPRLRWSFPRFSYHVNASLSRIHVHAYVGTHSTHVCVVSKRHTQERVGSLAVLLKKMEVSRCLNRIKGKLTHPMQVC